MGSNPTGGTNLRVLSSYLEERCSYKAEAVGSIPTAPTNLGIKMVAIVKGKSYLYKTFDSSKNQMDYKKATITNFKKRLGMKDLVSFKLEGESKEKHVDVNTFKSKIKK